MDWLELKLPPPGWWGGGLLLLALAMWWLAPLGPLLGWPDGVRPVLALALAVVGAGFDMTGLVTFVRRHTTINPLKPTNTSALVTSGIYRVTRNPMYVGLVCFLSAWAVWLGALWPWLGPVALCVLHHPLPDPARRAGAHAAVWSALHRLHRARAALALRPLKP